MLLHRVCVVRWRQSGTPADLGWVLPIVWWLLDRRWLVSGGLWQRDGKAAACA